MNINDFAPKHVNLADVIEQARTYEGTFTELLNLYKNGDITLVTDDDGNVISLWVDSHSDNLMIDTLTSQNFALVYPVGRTMEWLELILKAGNSPIDVNEYTGAVTINGKVTYVYGEPEAFSEDDGLTPAPVKADDNDDLPVCITVDGEIMSDYMKKYKTGNSAVRNYLKETFRHCLKKGTMPEVTYDGEEDRFDIDGIQWGRRLSNAELGLSDLMAD